MNALIKLYNRLCDVCGKRCKRGLTTTKNGVKTKHDPNKCSNE